MNSVDKIFRQIKLKYLVSRNVYIFLNLLTFFLVSALVIFNLFAIRFNPEKDPKTGLVTGNSTILWLFVSMSILSAIGGFVSSLLSFFVYREKAKKFKYKIKAIKEEIKQYDAKQEAYKAQNRNKILINTVIKIRNN